MNNEYPLQTKAALVIDAELGSCIQLAYDKKHASVPPEIQALLDDGTFARHAKMGVFQDSDSDYGDPSEARECCDKLGIGTCACSEFDGEATLAFPERCAPGAKSGLQFQNDFLLYIPHAREMSLFKAAYGSPEELLEEFKSHFDDVELPADFDWWARVLAIDGTYYC